jgi:hypothetical protein
MMHKSSKKTKQTHQKGLFIGYCLGAVFKVKKLTNFNEHLGNIRGGGRVVSEYFL